MGLVKICVHKTAKTPYFAEVTGINLYSIEELAYYLYENIYLIDERMIEEKLYSWLENELDFYQLAEKLRSGTSTGNHVYNQVMVILQASEYYSETELEILSEKIKSISGLQTQEKMKCKADEMFHNKNYWAAANEYERILSIRQNSRLDVTFYAHVWNNLANCYARLFLFEKAANCFENAYKFDKIEEYQEKAYYAKVLAGQENNENDLIERKLSEEFKNQALQMLRTMKNQSHEECNTILAEEFLENQEKQYYRITCV